MTCCKCEEHQWSDKPIDCMSYDGVEYCIFHNPHNKGISSEAFSQLVTERILTTGKENASVDLSGTIFPWDFRFSTHLDDHKSYTVDFNHAVFRGEADFNDAMLEISDFTGAKFEKKATFKDVDFFGDISFVDAEFSGTATFESSSFNHDAMFDRSIFFEKSNFNDVKFFGEANFGEATFHKRSMFRKSIFRQKASFMFTVFLSESLFTATSFFGETTFISTEFGSNTYFFDNEFSGVTVFTGSNISRKMYIGEPRVVSGTISLSGLSAGLDSIRIKGLNSEMMLKLFFIDVDVEYLCFLSFDWPDSLSVSDDNEENTKMLECIYRRLKQKSYAEHDQHMVSEWHFKEKCMFMRRKWYRRFAPLTPTWLYWASSGFGERPVRAWWLLVGICLVPLLLFGGIKALETHFSWSPDWHKVGEVFDDWRRCAPFIRVESKELAATSPPELWKLRVAWAFQILIAIQATLFGFALHNRFRR